MEKRFILNYLLTNQALCKGKFSGYRQNAFLSLIYLLSFRENNQEFATEGSDEYQLAEKVIAMYSSNPVSLKCLGQNQTLNSCFEELLKGSASRQSVENLIQAD